MSDRRIHPNSLANLRQFQPDGVSQAKSEKRLGPLRAEHARSLRRDFGEDVLPDRQLRFLADLLARCEAVEEWLDGRKSLVRANGEPLPVLADLHRWQSQAASVLSALEAARRDRPPPPVNFNEALANLRAGRFDGLVPDD